VTLTDDAVRGAWRALCALVRARRANRVLAFPGWYFRACGAGIGAHDPLIRFPNNLNGFRACEGTGLLSVMRRPALILGVGRETGARCLHIVFPDSWKKTVER